MKMTVTRIMNSHIKKIKKNKSEAYYDEAPGYKNPAGTGNFIPRPDYRPLTKFEKRVQGLGHGVWDLMAERIT